MEGIRETDGIVYGLYKHLWMKDQHGNSCDVNIPNTLVYCDGAPIAWYFTSNKESKMMRKRKDNLDGKKIAGVFMQRKDPNVDSCSWFSGSMTQFTGTLGSKNTNNNSANISAIVLLTDRKLKLEKITNQTELKEVLMTLGGIGTDDLIAFELLWTPQAKGDYYTKNELLIDFPNMNTLG
eukprot:gene24856-10516_t